MQNSTKPWLLVWSFFIFIALSCLLVGYQLGGRWGLLFGFVAAVSGTMIMFLYGESSLYTENDSDVLAGQEPWALLPVISSFASQLGTETPELQVIESTRPICYAVPSFFSTNRICISTSILDRLTAEEREALVASLCCQLSKSQSFLFFAVNVPANSLLGVATQIDRWLFKHKVLGNYAPMTSLVSPLCWLALRITRRKASFLAIDNLCSHLLHNKSALASALWKVENLNVTNPLSVRPGTSHLFWVNPYAAWTESLSAPKLFSRPFWVATGIAMLGISLATLSLVFLPENVMQSKTAFSVAFSISLLIILILVQHFSSLFNKVWQVHPTLAVRLKNLIGYYPL